MMELKPNTASYVRVSYFQWLKGDVPAALQTARLAIEASRDPAHPEPREGITAERVLAAEKVPKRYADAYDAAREIPEVLDGLYCHCDCAERDGLRSLLECFYGTMPQSCRVCLNEARLARRLHGQGRSLDEIRRAVDDEYRD